MAARNPRAAAQRATAKAVRERRRQLPGKVTGKARAAFKAYALRVEKGEEPYPKKGTLEAKGLARLASNARWNKEDPKYYALFSQYFYHDEKKAEAAIQDEEYEEEEDEEGE